MKMLTVPVLAGVILLSPPVLGQGGKASSYKIMNREVAPGHSAKIDLIIGENFTGDELPIPVFVIHGENSGPTMCLTAGIHGDEVNGIEIVRRVIGHIRSKKVNGTVIAIPIVNLPAFLRGMRYLPDRRDLNRYFPGRKTGSSASRIAYQVFEQVIKRCDYLLDFHTGSLRRTNMPQIRGDFRNTKVRLLMEAFGGDIAISKAGGSGTIRRAAVEAGIPAIIYEAGAPTRFEETKIRKGKQGALRLLKTLKILPGVPKVVTPTYFEYTYWVRAERGGIMLSKVKLGEKIKPNQFLAKIMDPFKAIGSDVRAEREGVVIGMAYNQVVMPGFALFHIGTKIPGKADSESEVGLDPSPDAEQPREEGPPE